MSGDLQKIYGKSLSEDDQARFALMLTAPSMSSTVRSSAWGASLTSSADGDEVKIQVNVCDLISACDTKARLAWYATVTGPLDKDADFNEMADLDGLFGTTRVGTGVVLNATQATWSKWPSLGIKVEGGRPEFSFAKSGSAGLDTVRKTTIAGDATVAWKNARAYASAAFRRESAWKEADPVNLCTPATVGPPGATECNAVAPTAPTLEAESIVKLEGRIALGERLAASLTYSYNLQTNVTGYDVPIWFIPDVGGGGLGAGVRAGYKTDTKKFSLTVFLAEFKL